MGVTLIVDTDALFNATVNATVEASFSGALTAADACRHLSWGHGAGEQMMAGLFSVALRGDGTRTNLTAHESPPPSFVDDIRDALRPQKGVVTRYRRAHVDRHLRVDASRPVGARVPGKAPRLIARVAEGGRALSDRPSARRRQRARRKEKP